MIVYRLRYIEPKHWQWNHEDHNTYFVPDKVSKNVGVIYLTEEAAKRAKASQDDKRLVKQENGEWEYELVENVVIVPFKLEEVGG